MGMALPCCLLGHAGGQEDPPPSPDAGCYHQTTEMQGPGAFLTRTFMTSLQRTGILGLRKPVCKVGIGGLWTVS